MSQPHLWILCLFSCAKCSYSNGFNWLRPWLIAYSPESAWPLVCYFWSVFLSGACDFSSTLGCSSAAQFALWDILFALHSSAKAWWIWTVRVIGEEGLVAWALQKWPALCRLAFPYLTLGKRSNSGINTPETTGHVFFSKGKDLSGVQSRVPR